MLTALRRLLILALIGGVAAVLWTTWQRRQPSAVPADADRAWPPIPEPTAGRAPWVDPVDGQCPEGHPVKANAKSGIFHVPGGRFYERTVPDRCYATATDAEADGYRAAKA